MSSVFKVELTLRNGDRNYFNPFSNWTHIEKVCESGGGIINYTKESYLQVKETPEEIFNLMKREERII